MADLSNLKIFSTPVHECSYLEGEEATTVFVDPNATISKELYSQLSELGFRRSGSHLYKPHCAYCSACVPTRVIVDEFTPNKQQRRTWRKNQDLIRTEISSITTDEHYQLYHQYISAVHKDGDMYPPSEDQYHSFLTSEWNTTLFYEFRTATKQLVAVAVTDKLSQGLSSIYTFYDPDAKKRSLGVFAILSQIEQAKSLGLPYLYLGYWIKRCKKMNYKINYQPAEILTNGHWRHYLEGSTAAFNKYFDLPP